MLLLDVEVRFDCAGSHKVSWRLLSASVLRGIYRRFVLLLDVFTADSCSCLMLKCVSTAQARTNSIVFAFLAAPGTAGVLSPGPAARVSGERQSRTKEEAT